MYFLILVLLPTSIITVTLYSQSAATLSDTMKSSIERNMTLMELNLSEKVEEINDITNNIYLSDGLQRLLSSAKPRYDVELVHEMTSLQNLLQSHGQSYLSRTRFRLNLYLMRRPEYHQYPFIEGVNTIESVQGTDWYQSIPHKTDYKVLGLYRAAGDDNRSPVYSIRFAKRLFELDNLALPYAGMLTADVDINDFNQVLTSLKPSERSKVYLLNEQNQAMIGPDPGETVLPTGVGKLLQERKAQARTSFDTATLRFEGVPTLLAVKNIPSLDWTIVTLTPVRDINGKLLAFRKIFSTVMVISVLLAVLLALYLSNNITSPIRRFVKSISAQPEEELFNISIDYKRNDEFSYLFRRFNRMIRQMKDLVDKLYVSEVDKKRAELEALQSQINPHFLYNTLDSVNWMALKLGAPQISRMVTSLSDFFRLSLNQGRSLITIDDEIRQVEAYLTIHQIRTSNKITYTLDIAPEVLPYLTVKLLLQPLVENAIVHGFKHNKGRGHIHIGACLSEGMIRLSVTDNGSGGAETVENIRELLAADRTSGSFGIRNVQARIKQWFGDGCGLSYTANETGGLTATVTLPLLKTMEELP